MISKMQYGIIFKIRFFKEKNTVKTYKIVFKYEIQIFI